MKSNNHLLSKKESLLSQEESSFMKGVFIFFVVLGHNVLFTSSISNSWLFLNSFPVAGFFILTFCYGFCDSVSFRSYVKKNISTLIPIYLLTFLFYAFTFYIFNQHHLPSLKDTLEAFLLGNTKIKEVTGFHMLWFFSSFFYFSIFKFFVLNKNLHIIFLFTLVFVIYKNLTLSYYSYLGINGILSALYFIPFAYITNLLIRKFYSIKLLFISVSIFCLFIVDLIYLKFAYFPVFLIPICAFITIYALSKNSVVLKSFVGFCFQKLGVFSLYIYISHSMIFYLIYFSFCNKEENYTKYDGIFTFIFTLLLSFVFSFFIKAMSGFIKQKINYLNKNKKTNFKSSNT